MGGQMATCDFRSWGETMGHGWRTAYQAATSANAGYMVLDNLSLGSGKGCLVRILQLSGFLGGSVG